MDHYQVLGVGPSATEDEIQDAYRELAKRFHPDRHPEASPAERLRYEDAMATINEAYHVLARPEARSTYDEARVQGPRDAPETRPPANDECGLCGHAPAASFVFEHMTAWLVAARRYGHEAVLCRHCARALGRAHQNRTLKTGWWGVRSFFLNFAVIWRNAAGLARAGRLRMPTRSPEVVGRIPVPLDPEPALLQRGGVYFAALVVAIVTAAGIGEAEAPREDTSAGRAFDDYRVSDGGDYVIPPTQPHRRPATTKPTQGVATDRASALEPGFGDWTVVLVSLSTGTNTRADALAEADRMGAIADGVFLSDDYASLNPGYWVIYSGVFRNEKDARQHCRSIKTQAAYCYQRYLS